MLLVLESTRALSLLIGLGMIYIGYFFASWFQLNGLLWLTNTFKTIWLISFVILFQPELRRALINLGQHTRFGRFFHPLHQSNEFISEIVRSLENMSKKSIGALIVIEREIELNDIINKSGEKIESTISAEILEALFTPYGPLHDGAVIIRHNKIIAAGCVLPLTSTLRVGSVIGTRHRAAIGVSEETDAIALVVSEETGAISICENGKLISNIKRKNLKDKIDSCIIGKNKIKQTKTNDETEE